MNFEIKNITDYVMHNAIRHATYATDNILMCAIHINTTVTMGASFLNMRARLKDDVMELVDEL